MSSPGEVLSRARLALGVSLEQAAGATRIRSTHLGALERWDLRSLPAPVYVRGYLRTYSAYLGVDALPLLLSYSEDPVSRPGSFSIEPVAPPPAVRGPVVSGPLLGALALVLLVLAFTGYSVRQLEAAGVYDVPSVAPVSPVFATPAPLPSPSLAPVAKTITVTLETTEVVWLDVTVDGRRQAGTYPAGTTLAFTGRLVKVASGKAGATLVSLDGHAIGALGAGVTVREFAAQT
jgi:hypothetical protein